jgi:FAD/FMN-containing dehydrogenase
VVSADGTVDLVRASAGDPDPDLRDLFWAHQGGGGGNFGIVTRFWFRDLPKAPETAQLLTLAWNWPDLDQASFSRIVANYGAFFAANSDPGSDFSGLFALLHLTQAAAGQVALVAQDPGPDPARLAAFAREMGAGVPSPVASQTAVGHHHTVAATTAIRQLPWLYATQTLNGTGPNQRGKYKSAYMLQPFPDDQVATIWKHLTQVTHPNPQALLQVDSYGCQVNAIASGDTAIPQRSSIMKLQYQTYWTGSNDDKINLEWIRRFYHEMYGVNGPMPDDLMDGCYVNYPDVDLVNWPELYYKGNYPRLQATKARWDPGNVFNHRQSIALPGRAEVE